MTRAIRLAGGQVLRVPPEVDEPDVDMIVSVSGGKDSTAMMLALREAELEFASVFADTGWEAPETYEYLDMLREAIGPISVVGYPGGMVAKIIEDARFPSRRQRWCTRVLKIEPLRAFHDEWIDRTGNETVSVVGVRADESAARANLDPFVDEPSGPRSWGGYIWRPMLHWSVEDVLDMHARHGVPVNPLYQRGHDRVGCYPCCMENKQGIRLLAEHDHARIVEISKLEAQATALRKARNVEQPGRYKYENASFFQRRSAVDDPSLPIESAVEWSRTVHGGRQFPLFPEQPSGGCMRWGLCDVVRKDSDE